MSDEHPGSGQPIGQLSPDGQWRWDGHNWVPAQQQSAPQYPHPPQPQQPQQPQYGAAPQYGTPYPNQQYGGQQYPNQPYGAMQPKKGLPTWAKVLIILLSLFVALIVLLTVVGLTVDESYADWSCEELAEEALTIDDEDDALVLADITDLEIVEDNREDFNPPETGRGLVLSCQGTGSWEDVDETLPVLIELSASADGDEWVSYEMAE